nr:hypothetical protein [Tanacetum cinerariifolium]
MLYQALGLPQKLEQSLLLGGRESVSDRCGLASECSERQNAGGEHVLRRSRESTGYTPYPHSEIARDASLLSQNKSQILPGGRDMDLFNLIRAPNLTKVKTGSRPRAAHKVPPLTLTANRMVKMEDPAISDRLVGCTLYHREVPFGLCQRSWGLGPRTHGPRGATAHGHASHQCSPGRPSRRGVEKDHADPRPTGSTYGGKSLAALELGLASTRPVPVPKNAPAGVSDLDPLSFADPHSRHPADIAQSSQGTAAAGDPESGNASFASAVGSLDSIYRPEWGVPNGSMLDTPEACQDLVDHVAPPGYFSELRHLHNDDFIRQYNVNLARQVAMGSQLHLRFEQEAKLLRKSVAQLGAEADMKKATKDRSAGLSQELEDMRAQFSDLQVSNERLSQQAATLQEHVSGEEKLKAAFEEFKRYEDSRVEQRCTEMDARLDALSIDFDEELYPHMLTAITGRRWVIGRGLILALMKCGESLELRQAFADVVTAGIAKGMSEGLRHGVEHGQAQLSLESIEACDPEAEAKYVAALQALKDLKYPLVDQLEGLKNAPMNVIMAALYLESDTGDDAPQHVRDLCPSSFQLTIPVYPEVRDPMNPWACKEEMSLADAIVANISCTEKKKKCRIVFRTHGVGSAHHARSDGVPISVPTVVP